MAIDHYDILVPAYIESGTPFEVQVLAKDAGGDLVDDDSTVVTLSSSSTFVLFDSSGNGIYGEPGDDQDTLLDGIIQLLALDTKGTSFTLTATAPGAITGEDTVSYNFNCIVFGSLNPEQTELSTLSHQRFLRRVDLEGSEHEMTNATKTLSLTDDFSDTGYSVIV